MHLNCETASLKMPSEYQKKKLAKKKEAAKVKGGKKTTKEGTPDDSGASTPKQNGTSTPNGASAGRTEGVPLTYEEELCKRLEEEAHMAAEARACTGVLGIHPMSRDIKIDNLSVTFHGVELLLDTKLELSVGQRCVLDNYISI